MHSVALIGLLCASAIRAGVTPTAPGPGQSFNEGADCPIQWDLDTTGKWTSFSIDLMTGSNTAMTLVTNVASGLDGTKGDKSHTWKCPSVTPNSAIYFYQFSQTGVDAPTWTTRFAIASASGELTPPSNTAQPDGKNIPWGTGRLEGAAATTTASSTPAVNTSTAATTTNSSAATQTGTITGSNPAATPATNSTTNSTLSGGVATTTTPSAGASTSTGTASSSGVTPKLSQSPSTAGQTTSKGTTSGSSSGSTTAPTSGASPLLSTSFTLVVLVFVTMIFLA